MDEGRSSVVETGVGMDNKNVLDIGSIISDINQSAATRLVKLFSEIQTGQDKKESHDTKPAEYEDRDPISDFDAIYQELYNVLSNIKQRWGTDDTERNLFNSYYQRDLFYLYDRITLDMNYLKGYPDKNDEWLEQLQELKYEIRNLL